jgi:hypothetical protein
VYVHINGRLTNIEELKDNSGPLKEQFLKLTSMKGLFHEVQLMETEKGHKKFTADREKITGDGTEAEIYEHGFR